VALQEVPLVHGVWLDRTIAELDLCGTLLAQAGLAFSEGEDDTPLAWPLLEQDDGDPLPLPLHPQGMALRQQTARTRLAQGRGRTTMIAGWPYLESDAYLA